MNKALAIILAISLAVLFIAIGFTISRQTTQAETQEARTVYYITKCQSYITMEGGEDFVLDYARNGEMQTQAVFNSAAEMNDFMTYLEIFGLVINKGALK